jgi:hypothetical protein
LKGEDAENVQEVVGELWESYGIGIATEQGKKERKARALRRGLCKNTLIDSLNAPLKIRYSSFGQISAK